MLRAVRTHSCQAGGIPAQETGNGRKQWEDPGESSSVKSPPCPPRWYLEVGPSEVMRP